MTSTSPPPWLAQAWTSFGITEAAGSANNANVLAFYRDAGHPEIRSDDVAWCAAFVGACLERAGLRCTRSLLARSYLTWGDELYEPRTGAIAVLTRGSDPTFGHVGFLVGSAADRVFLLGGNQADSVSIQAFARERVLSWRWPAPSVDTPRPTVSENDPSIFDTALAHVLDMEGGYTDDPHDPGGPTNLGITLATFAAWRKTTLTAENFGPLKADLRALDRATAADIYRTRYWRPSRAADMPAAVALMHFDASVNHGVGGAARMLQSACGVEVDGEIGPATLAAANSNPLGELLDRYAEIREARYRALPHFWRFGRGWLARILKTRAAAAALIPPTHKPKVNQPMSNENQEPKWWGNSVAIWGTLVTAISTVLPVVAPMFGISLTADTIQQIGAGVLQLVQVAGGLIGTVMAIYGRARATQPLMRRPISLRF
jgi:uncharacterized protein (TIGR02594 family)